MGSHTKRDPIFLYFLHVRHKENVFRFVDNKHGDEKGKGLQQFTTKEVVIPNSKIFRKIFRKILRNLSSRVIQDAKTSNHICISNNKTRQAEKSIYSLAVKKMGIAKRLII